MKMISLLGSLWRALSSSKPTSRHKVRRALARVVETCEGRRLLSASPVPVGPEAQINTSTTGNQLFSGVASDAAGDYAVVWVNLEGQDGDGAGVFMKRYNSSGVQQGIVTQVNTHTQGDQTVPTIAMNSSGDFVISWTEFNSSGGAALIFARKFSANGVAVGDPIQVTSQPQGYTDEGIIHSRVAMDSSGDFVVAWDSLVAPQNGYDVWAHRYNAAGASFGASFMVNTYTTGTQGGLDGGIGVGMDSAGDFVVSWHSAGEFSSGIDVVAQRFSASGSRIGGEFLVNTTIRQNIAAPRLAMNSSGQFVIAWSVLNGDGVTYRIFAQRFGTDGTAVGDEFQVNSTRPGSQYVSSIAMDPSGDFVVAWNSGQYQGPDSEVVAQVYTSSGVPQGGEVLLNSYATGAQGHGRVAMDASGNFVATWQSDGQDGSGYGVYARRFREQANIPPRGTSTTVTTLDNASYIFTLQDFGFDDSNDPAPNNFLSVRITSFPSTGNLTFGGAPVALNQPISASAINANALVFTPTSIGSASTSFQFQVQDDGGTAFGGSDLDPSPKLMTIRITASDIAPTLSNIESSIRTYSGSAPVIVTSAVSVNDVDNTSLSGATIQITGGYQSSSDSLQFTTIGNIVGAWDAGTASLVFSGQDTLANYQSVLRSVSFKNLGTNTDTRMISFQIFDGTLWSNTVSRAVDTAPIALSLITASPNPTAGPTVQFTLTFSEPVAGVDPTDFSQVVSGSVARGVVHVTPVTNSQYLITVDGITGPGTMGINLVKDGTIQDANSQSLVNSLAGKVFTIGVAPAITAQPDNLTVTAGTIVSFTAGASGTPTPNAQWQVSLDHGANWTNVSGATSTTYRFLTTVSSAETLYREVFTNTVGTAITNSASLTVNPGVASKLGFLQRPPAAGTAGVGLSPTVQVAVQDAYGNIVTTDNSTVTLSIPVGGVANTYTAAASAGIATLNVNNVVVTKSGDYVWTASDGTLTKIAASLAIASTTASQLVISVSPVTGTAGVVLAAPVRALIEDQYGNVVTTDSSAVTINVNSGPGAFAAGSTLTVNAVAGVANFNNLILNTSGIYKFAVSDQALTGTVTGNVTVAAGAAANLVIVSSPTSATAGIAIPGIKVGITDQFGNPLSTTSAVTMTLVGGTFSTGQTKVTANTSAGVAIFTGLMILPVGSYQLTASAAGLSSVSFDLIVNPGAASKLIFIQRPPVTGTAGVGLSPTVLVAVQDAFGNLAATDNSTVTLSIPVGGTTNSYTAIVSAGIATLSVDNLLMTKAGDYVWTVSDGALTKLTSSLAIAPTTASKLVISVSPVTGTAGVVLAAPVRALVEDQYGNVVTTDTSPVTISVAAGPGPFAASDVLTVNAVGGVANFNNLVLNTSGIYRFGVSDGALTGAATGNVSIAAGPAANMAIISSPATATAGTAIPEIKVGITDQFGNLVSVLSAVTLTLVSGTFSTGQTKVVVNTNGGIATFTGLTILTAGSYTLIATAGSLPSTAFDFTVNPGAASKLAFLQRPPTAGTAGVALTPTVQVAVQDAFGNLVTSDNSVVSLSIPVGSSKYTYTAIVSAGVATVNVDNLVITKAGDYTWTLSDGALTTLTSRFTIAPATANKLVISVSPVTGTTGVVLAAPVRALVEDQFGNVVTTDTSTVTISVSSGPDAFAASSVLMINAVGGVANFNNLILNTAGTYRFAVSDGALTGTVTGNVTIASAS